MKQLTQTKNKCQWRTLNYDKLFIYFPLLFSIDDKWLLLKRLFQNEREKKMPTKINQTSKYDDISRKKKKYLIKRMVMHLNSGY